MLSWRDPYLNGEGEERGRKRKERVEEGREETETEGRERRGVLFEKNVILVSSTARTTCVGFFPPK
jgi:hypothetical protein